MAGYFSHVNNAEMKKTLYFLIVTLAVFALGGCADSVHAVVECAPDCHTYGFWGGLWHGMIAPFDFIGMLIWPDDVALYAQDNNGGWYAFGFVLGSGILAGGTSATSSKIRN